MATRKSAVHLNKPGEIITWFDDLGTGNAKYRFLSNFYVGEPIVIPGINMYGTYGGWKVRDTGRPHSFSRDTTRPPHGPWEFHHGEGAFAAFKAANQFDFFEIAWQEDPGDAKRLGRKVDLRHDWERIKLDVMMMVLRAKFTHEREEGRLLLETGDALLVEGTFWGDEVWGVDLNRGDERPGRNWLGTMLMARRAELRAPVQHDTIRSTVDFLLRKPKTNERGIQVHEDYLQFLRPADNERS